MKPVAIFRHSKTEGPGYFATFLESHSIPWQLIAVDRGERIPATAENYSGIALMGGPMSVNDRLPWIEDSCALIRDAHMHNIPVIGHCLGGQLMSKAFGGQITPSPFKEIGWGTVTSEGNDTARHWLGEAAGQAGSTASVFQWHGEMFSIPPGAQRIMTNVFCANQMFALGPHLAMQYHVEMTPEMIGEWCESWPDEVRGLNPLPATVQRPEEMQKETAARLEAMRHLANRLYSVWIDGLGT